MAALELQAEKSKNMFVLILEFFALPEREVVVVVVEGRDIAW